MKIESMLWLLKTAVSTGEVELDEVVVMSGE
jgi:hypothetical protein